MGRDSGLADKSKTPEKKTTRPTPKKEEPKKAAPKAPGNAAPRKVVAPPANPVRPKGVSNEDRIKPPPSSAPAPRMGGAPPSGGRVIPPSAMTGRTMPDRVVSGPPVQSRPTYPQAPTFRARMGSALSNMSAQIGSSLANAAAKFGPPPSPNLGGGGGGSMFGAPPAGTPTSPPLSQAPMMGRPGEAPSQAFVNGLGPASNLPQNWWMGLPEMAVPSDYPTGGTPMSPVPFTPAYPDAVLSQDYPGFGANAPKAPVSPAPPVSPIGETPYADEGYGDGGGYGGGGGGGSGGPGTGAPGVVGGPFAPTWMELFTSYYADPARVALQATDYTQLTTMMQQKLGRAPTVEDIEGFMRLYKQYIYNRRLLPTYADLIAFFRMYYTAAPTPPVVSTLIPGGEI